MIYKAFGTIVLAVMVTVIPALSCADEISAVMASIESDPEGASKKLLQLSDANRANPALVQSLVQAARSVGRQGHWPSAIALLQRARQSPLTVADTATIDLAIASAAWQASEWSLVVNSADAIIAAHASPAHLAAAYPLLIQSLAKLHQYQTAVEALTNAIPSSQQTQAEASLAELAYITAANCLQQKQATAAQKAYEICLQLAADGPRATDAQLGIAWAAALGASSPEVAIEKLLAFAQRWPQHADAPAALRAAATCARQAGDNDQADGFVEQLWSTYPCSNAALATLLPPSSDEQVWSKAMRQAWLSRIGNDDCDVPASQLAASLFQASKASDESLRKACEGRLLTTDLDGAFTGQVLDTLAKQDKAIAEHLVTELLARSSESSNGNALVAACRWAGMNQRWSIVADHATRLFLNPRPLELDRLIAESLVQSHQPAESLPWWNDLIERGANDFNTLLRAAETAVNHGTVELATQRIDSALDASGDDVYQRGLVELLSAELAIRRTRFDEARGLLEAIVRNADCATMRPRAQWLIGETYFLQQRYADAIDAYRRVDAIEGAGAWAAAALLQAGKAFEKLDSSREAVVCYTALVNRFPNWQYAQQAHARLATLQGDTKLR